MKNTGNATSFLNETIPWDSENNNYRECAMFKSNTSRDLVPCSDWVYDKSGYKSSRGMDVSWTNEFLGYKE